MKIYLAGPLFTTAECAFNLQLAKLLRHKGHVVFLPQEQEQNSSPSEIFASDVKGIDWAEVIVANMDGADPDSGTCWECGYAYRKKPIICFRTDIRRDTSAGETAPYNLMLTESAQLLLHFGLASTEFYADKIEEALKTISIAGQRK